MESDQLLSYVPNSDASSLFNRILIELASIHRFAFFLVLFYCEKGLASILEWFSKITSTRVYMKI